MIWCWLACLFFFSIICSLGFHPNEQIRMKSQWTHSFIVFTNVIWFVCLYKHVWCKIPIPAVSHGMTKQWTFTPRMQQCREGNMQSYWLPWNGLFVFMLCFLVSNGEFSNVLFTQDCHEKYRRPPLLMHP